MGRPIVNRIGFRSGRLTVIELAAQTLQKQAIWRCLCDCGEETLVVSSRFTGSVMTQSCGCLVGDARRARVERDSISLADRFWKFVNKTEACWLWTGATRNGYGVIGAGGRANGIVYAHRQSFIMHHGPIPKGMEVCHHCDVRPCVRDTHLFAGTRSDNMQDASAKGRLRTPSRWHDDMYHTGKEWIYDPELKARAK